MEANQALVDLLKQIAEQKKATPAQTSRSPGCWVQSTLGRADPRHDQAPPARREYRRGERPTEAASDLAGDRACGVRNHGQGRALSGTAYDDDWPVSGRLPTVPVARALEHRRGLEAALLIGRPKGLAPSNNSSLGPTPKPSCSKARPENAAYAIRNSIGAIEAARDHGHREVERGGRRRGSPRGGA